MCLNPLLPTLLAVVLALPASAQVPPSAEEAAAKVPPDLSAPTPKNYWVPLLEGPILYNLGQTLLARSFADTDTFDSNWESIKDNLNGPWWYDEDKFRTNQWGHPYQGSVYMTAARSMGLNFYEGFLYTTLGSFVWEIAGETEPPSVNDQITTSIAGTLYGEIMFRSFHMILDTPGRPGFWREAGATVVSPASALNRWIFKDKYKPQGLAGYPWFAEGAVSLGFAGRSYEGGVRGEDPGGSVGLRFRFSHGLLSEDWKFRRPFDHFDVRMSLVLNDSATGAEAFGTQLIRGLVAGGRYGEGPSRGLCGLFAAYDYVAPRIYRVSSTNLAFGTVGRLALGESVALEGTAYAGVGYGAGGSSEAVGSRDYHFGLQGVALLEGTLHFANRTRLRLAGRGYYISGKVSPDEDSFEYIGYGEASLAVRLFGAHAVEIEAIGSRRRALYPDVPDIRSRVSSLVVSYLFTGDPELSPR